MEYRVWDGNEMHYGLSHMIAPNGLPYQVMRIEGKDIIVNNGADSEVIVQPCLGFTDRKGKKIYEGDIIEWDGRPGGLRQIMRSETTTGYKASWNLGSFMVTPHSAKWMTVIGNIFENKDLLE